MENDKRDGAIFWKNSNKSKYTLKHDLYAGKPHAAKMLI